MFLTSLCRYLFFNVPDPQADPGSEHINGTLTYQANVTGWQIAMGFAAVQGEWMFDVEYLTKLDVVLMNGDTGNRPQTFLRT